LPVPRGWSSPLRDERGHFENETNLISDLLFRSRGQSNYMKMCHLLFWGFAGVMASGCSLKVASPPPGNASVAPVAESTVVTVPLPAQTPYDGNPKAKAAYLEYYAMGYQLAMTAEEYASPGCLCTAEGDAERYEASMSGFFAGKDAGAAALAKKRLQNPRTPAGASAPPPATPSLRQR